MSAKLMTEAEAKLLWGATFSQHAKSFAEYLHYLHDRGLIAPDPVDPLLAEVELIFEPPVSDNETKAMIYQALRRGRDIGLAEQMKDIV